MITLICTKCKATLEMDDAFAGGVCRCQYCGTIQTVPSHLKQTARGVSAGQKALYSTKAASGAGLPSSGLDELANVVASSGLASGLANRTASPETRTHAQPTRLPAGRKAPLLIGGAVVLVLIGIIIFLLASRPPAPPAPAPQVDASPGQVDTASQRQGGPRPTAGPNFLDIPIDATKVVYLLDRGQSSREVLDPIKDALYESIESLGADRDFQVLFWTTPASEKPDVHEFAFPKQDMAKANKDRLQECKQKFEDLTTSGRTDVAPVMIEAMKRNPQVIFIVTAKGINLDDTTVKAVNKARGTKPVIIHTIDLTRQGEGESVLRAIAQNSGGIYKHLEPHVLRDR